MANPNFDRERAARVIAMAAAVGDDEAAKAAGVSTRTIARWRKRVATDSSLSEAVEQKNQQIQTHLDAEFRDFLAKAVRKLGQLIDKSGVEHIYQVAGAVKIVGDLTNTRGGLGLDEKEGGESGGQPSGTGPDPSTSEDARVVPIRGIKGVRAAE